MHKEYARRRLQFRVLYHVFLLRVVDLELMSANGDPTRLLGQFAAMFSSVSFLFSLPGLLYLTGRGRLAADYGWTAEHFFIATTLTAVGMITVLNWDSAFPDRRDLLVLGPLPVRASTLFLAKISALVAAPGLAVLGLNIFSGLVWPVLFVSGKGGLAGLLRVWPAYWITMFATGGFIVCTVLAVQGLAANLLPRQHFLRLSAFLQAGFLCLLLSLYLLEPHLESSAALTAPENQRLLEWLPSYWFLGLFQQLNGSMNPAFLPLARRAWMALEASGVGAGLVLLFSYFRMMPRIVEQPDILPRSRGISWPSNAGDSLKTAMTLFVMRTLLRSGQHRMILSFFSGIGLAIVVGYVTFFDGWGSKTKGLSIAFAIASILILVFVIVGIRAVAAIPISLSANWIIRVTQVRPSSAYREAVRFSWIALGVAPIWLLVAGLLLTISLSWQVFGHLVVLFVLGTLLVELCLLSFPKTPFTCSYLPGKANIHIAFWSGLVLLFQSVSTGARFESRVLNRPLNYGLMILLLSISLAGLRRLTEARARRGVEVVFEEEYPVDLVSLNLS
ncbi:MAG TPA: hypothetical protein VHU44_17685 [Acidobacteriaceae bacterium]|nr:hypothetical protein [Acidobacteriaceae bacterium]